MSKDRFHLYKIFKNDAKVTISQKEIAKLYGVTLEQVRMYIQKDLQSKMIYWEGSSSTFYLAPRGFEFLFCIRRDCYTKEEIHGIESHP